MTKKHFIALADAIREHNRLLDFKTGTGLEHLREATPFDTKHLEALADALTSMNPRFMPNRWIGYIKGQCGPNGGSVK